jgi:hypothetical protein
MPVVAISEGGGSSCLDTMALSDKSFNSGRTAFFIGTPFGDGGHYDGSVLGENGRSDRQNISTIAESRSNFM